MEQLKSKTSCISALCACLTNTPHITLVVRLEERQWMDLFDVKHTNNPLSTPPPQPSAALPCPPGSVVAAVLSLLQICSGLSSSPGHRELCRNVISSGKVQKCALEALTALSGSPGKIKRGSPIKQGGDTAHWRCDPMCPHKDVTFLM